MHSYSFTDASILKDNCWPKVEACYSRTWDFHNMPPHFHERAEIMYVLKGWCYIHLYEYRLEAGTQKILIKRHWTEQLGPGEFIFLDQGVLHQLEIRESNYMLNAEFAIVNDDTAVTTLGRLAQSSPNFTSMLKRRQKIIRGRDDAGIMVRPLTDVIVQFSETDPKDNALADALMAELLLRLARCINDQSGKANTFNYVRRAREYIETHLQEDIRIADVAKHVGVAPAYLQRIFKQSVGMTIVEYTNQLRIDHSKQLLRFTKDSILEIAMASGFNSRQHFSRVFNAAVGTSPQQYRQIHHPTQTQQIYHFDNVNDFFYDLEGNRQDPD